MSGLPPIILASASPRRSELLRKLEVDFQVVVSAADESESCDLTAREVAQLNAYRKARAVARNHPDSLVIGADTVVSLGETLFGKPADLAAAARMLAQLQGTTHEVITGVCLIHLRARRWVMFAETTAVTFRSLDSAQIRDYLSRINPLDKAGAYAIQEFGDEIISQISGSFSNVVGLPLERLGEVLGGWS